MEKIKIKALRGFAGTKINMSTGEVRAVEKSIAASLIRSGYAEEVAPDTTNTIKKEELDALAAAAAQAAINKLRPSSAPADQAELGQAAGDQVEPDQVPTDQTEPVKKGKK